jgi:hypothetical protein
MSTYSTVWAYEQACAALHSHRERADKAEMELAEMRAGEAMIRQESLDRYQQALSYVRKLISLAEQLPDRPGAQAVREIRSGAARAKTALGWSELTE